MSSAQAPLWTRNFILVGLINFQLVLIFYLLVIVIVGYAVAELNASIAEAGLISGLFIVGTLFGRLLIGKCLQRFGYRSTLLFGLAGFLLLSLGYFIEMGVTTLLGIRFIHGFMMGVASTVLGTVIAQTLPPTRRGEGIGYYSMSSTLGTAIGPFVAIWMMLHTSYQTIFSLSSVLALGCLVVACFIRMPNLAQPKPAATATAGKGFGFWTQYLEKNALPISLIMLFASICYSGVLSFINFYAKEIDLVEAASLFFLMYAIAILFSRPFTGRLMDRKGENIIMYPAFIVMAIALFLLSQAHNSSMLLLCAGLLGLGYGNIQSVCQTIAVKSTSLERMGLATSTYFICLDAGLGFGPYLIGIALKSVSYAQMYFYSAIAALLCLGLYYLLHGRHAQQVQPQLSR